MQEKIPASGETSPEKAAELGKMLRGLPLRPGTSTARALTREIGSSIRQRDRRSVPLASSTPVNSNRGSIGLIHHESMFRVCQQRLLSCHARAGIGVAVGNIAAKSDDLNGSIRGFTTSPNDMTKEELGPEDVPPGFVLCERARKIWATKDEDYHHLTWEEIKEIIGM
jgi:hypothetical protein